MIFWGEAMRRGTTLLAAIVLAGAGLSATACTTSDTEGRAAKAETVTNAANAANAETVAKGGKAAKAASCSVTWGSLPKESADTGYNSLVNVRTGRHDCYDRMVLDVDGASSTEPIGYRVSYVSALHQDGSGELIPVSGGAILEISASAPSYDPETGDPTYAGHAGDPLPGVDIAGYQTFRDTRFGASFEGQTQIGLGVRARLPFRVFQRGDRLVIDVAHSWASTG